MTVDTTQHCAFTPAFLLTWSSWLHRPRHILKTLICHVSSVRLPSLRSSTSVDPPYPFVSRSIVYADGGYLLGVPCRSFIRSCVTGSLVPTPFSLTSPIPPGTTLKGRLASPCSLSEVEEDTPGRGATSCLRRERSHVDTADLRQRGIERS